MSYSFSVAAASKALALAAASAELDKVVAAQAVHHNDHDLAEAAIDALLEATREPSEGEEVRVSVSGSLGWNKVDPKFGEFTHANLSINIAVLAKT